MKSLMTMLSLFVLTVMPKLLLAGGGTAGGGASGGGTSGGGASGGGTTGGGATSGGTSGGGSGGAVTIDNPLAANSITEFFLLIIEILLIFAIPIIVFFIILAGFKFVTARGNQSTLDEAKRALLYAIIGGLLILGANLILAVIQNTVDSFTV